MVPFDARDREALVQPANGRPRRSAGSVAHQAAAWGAFQEIARDAAEHPFPQPGMAVGARDDQIRVLPQGEPQDLRAGILLRLQVMDGDVRAVPREVAGHVVRTVGLGIGADGRHVDPVRRPQEWQSRRHGPPRCGTVPPRDDDARPRQAREPRRHHQDRPAGLHEDGPGRHAERSRIRVARSPPAQDHEVRGAGRLDDVRDGVREAGAPVRADPLGPGTPEQGLRLFEDGLDLCRVALLLRDGIVDIADQEGAGTGWAAAPVSVAAKRRARPAARRIRSSAASPRSAETRMLA